MKNLYKIFILTSLLLCLNIFAQEPVVFHFNFSFEKESWTNLKQWTLTDDIENIAIKIHNYKKHLIWEKSFVKGDLTKDDYGYCLLSDTIKNLKNSFKPYILKVNYLLASGINDSCKMYFSYPDSVKKLALELFFDQALITKESEDTLRYRILEYGVSYNPKPTLVVKYLNNEQNIYLGPTWFDYWLTKRPKYILYNNSSDTMFRADDGFLTCYFGYLQILDSTNQWKRYLFGGICGTFNCDDPIKPGQIYDIVEAYPIGDPLKLMGGYYKYSVDYKDSSGSKKTVKTYFTVIYSKPY